MVGSNTKNTDKNMKPSSKHIQCLMFWTITVWSFIIKTKIIQKYPFVLPSREDHSGSVVTITLFVD